MWAHLLTQHGRVTWVSERAGHLVDFLSARHSSSGLAELELTAVYVLPDCYGHGERRSDESGVLEVWAGNLRAIEFYRRRGWLATAGTRPGPQGVDFVTYRLPPTAGPAGQP